MALPAKRRIDVLGTTMACVDTGAGPVTFLLLHGNPTSSYLWRDVIPELEPLGRCVAPDLVGMGDSAKLPDPGPGSYGFAEHRRYLDALLDALELTQPLVLVIHDWGSALGFDWARRHPDRVAGIAYMEAIVRPLSWDEWPEAARGIFQGFRSPKGEELILERNLFVEAVLPSAILRTLSDEELAEYRRPFLAPGEDRRPTLTWPRQLPIDGEPADVVADVQAYADWLAGAPVPKLFVDAQPGSILTGPAREFCRTWPEQEEVTVPGSHFVQEDSGAAIGRAVAEWATRRVLGG
jgi:haloalkane dehalogenase